MRILVIEDEPKVAEALRAGLTGESHDVVVAHTGEDGFFRAGSETFDVVILDIMLPGRDGLEILRTLRAQGDHTPVIVLTARDAIDDRVRGLDAGADDYLVKPFAFAELLARIRALMRRGRADGTLRLVVGDLEMDLVTRKTTRAGEELSLTPREYELLEYFMRQPGQVVARDMLARDVWRETERATSIDNVIDVHVGRLRKKLGDARAQRLQTVRGVGFLLREETS